MKKWLISLILCGVFACVGQAVFAQTDNGINIEPPDFSVDTLQTRKSDVDAEPNLTDDQKNAIKEFYDVAITAMNNAVIAFEDSSRFRRELENSPRTIERLRGEINALEGQSPDIDVSDDDMTGETLFRMEQELIVRESEMRTLRAEINGLEDELQALISRPIRQELNTAQSRLVQITTELTDMGDGDLERQEQARRVSLEARQYYRRAQTLALEQELAGLAARQQIVTLRRDLATLKVQRAEQLVLTLQSRTGQRRLTDALEIEQTTKNTLGMMEKAHPFIADFAAENISISEELTSIARESSRYPRLQAEARRERDITNNDLKVAQQLTDLTEVNRQSSAMLRQLRNQKPSINRIKSELDRTQKQALEATQNRLWAQEQMRKLPIGEVDYKTLLDNWKKARGITDEMVLSTTDRNLIRSLYVQRRSLLNEVSDAAFFQLEEADSLRTIQSDLLKNVETLSAILDQKLLWLPSIRSVDGSWPQRVMRGALQFFSPDTQIRVWSVFVGQLRALWFVAILCLGVIGLLLAVNRSLRQDIKDRSTKVGRVQQDSYLHTPAAIIACAVLAAPIPLLCLFVGILFRTSGSPDQVVTAFGQTFTELSGFLWFFFMWREWVRDKSLFDAHFGLAKPIRQGLLRNLRWFIPIGGVLIGLVTVTQNSRQPDVYEGFSLLAFIGVAATLSYFAYRILWTKRSVLEKSLSEQSFLGRHRNIIAALTVGLPVMAAILAAAGYYDTARELLSRLFFSGGLVIGTYVAYGLIKRTVYVAQRRLALKQAVERREKMVKAREQAEAAEERGDPAPPPLDYEEIDVDTISRQSSELLNTLILIGFAVLMWIFWQDLLPALSIFDNVELWTHEVKDSEGLPINEAISLWNVMQAVAIVILTIIASKNLPGFLEIFVLNRSKMDAGTRYAVVNILGYIIVAIGIFIAFNRLGTEWSQFQWIVAALGVGIGFGLQEIIANFISGLIILFERPVRVGDYVTIGDQSGTVNRIQIRATTLGDLDNREILIPNKALITERVTNWTLSNSTTRLIVRVGIAYGSDTDAARQIMLDTIKANERVMDTPRPQVFFLGFGDSSLDFEIRVFLRSFEDRFPTSHALHTEINKALEQAGITIPFPQRDLHVVSGLHKAPDTQ